jgi:hypothetical protein
MSWVIYLALIVGLSRLAMMAIAALTARGLEMNGRHITFSPPTQPQKRICTRKRRRSRIDR